MSGIDKIIKQIEEDTATVCDDIMNRAQAQADSILADAQTEAAAILSEAEQKTAAKVEDIRKRGDSAAELEERRVLLYTKQDIISKMLEKGIEEVKNLPDDEYFGIILQMIGKSSQPQDGIIRFGEKDLSRLPRGFERKMNDVSKGSLKLDKDPVKIDAGFILIYGGIEENCSFDAIFQSEAETLSDRAGRLLF